MIRKPGLDAANKRLIVQCLDCKDTFVVRGGLLYTAALKHLAKGHETPLGVLAVDCIYCKNKKQETESKYGWIRLE